MFRMNNIPSRGAVAGVSPKGIAQGDWRRLAVVAATVLMVSACGGGGGDTTTEPSWTVEAPTTSALEAGGSAVTLAVRGGTGETMSWSLDSALGSLVSTGSGTAVYTPPPAGSLSEQVTVVITVRSAKGETRTVSITLRPSTPPSTGWSLGPVTDAALQAGGAGVPITVVNNGTGRPISWSLSPAVGRLVDAGPGGVTYVPPDAGTISASTRVVVSATDDQGRAHSVAFTVDPVTTQAGFLTAQNGVVVGEGGVPLGLALDVLDPGVTWRLTPSIGTMRTTTLRLGTATLVQGGLYTPPTAGVLSKSETVTLTAIKSGGATSTLTLTVKPTLSAMSKQAWSTPKVLESDDRPVQRFKAAIDDNGRLTVVFVKSDGTRDVLYAVHGTPGAAGAEPVWSAPVPIDLTAAGTAVAPIGSVFNGFDSSPAKTLSDVAVAPNGDAYVAWLSAARCGADTYSTATNRDCAYLYGARYSAATGTWSRAELLGNSPEVSGFGGPPKVMINDAGDLAVQYKGWERIATTPGYKEFPAVLWRQAGSATIRHRVFSDMAVHTWFQYFDAGMDAVGNLMFAGQSYQNSTVDIVAYQGTVKDGFGSQRLIDERGAEATFDQMAFGRNGQAVLLWTQANGNGATTTHAATWSGSGAWAVTDLGSRYTVDSSLVKDSGEAVLNLRDCSSRHWIPASGWEGVARILPSGCRKSVHVTNGLNDQLSIDTSTGRWFAYDARENAMVQPMPLDAAGALTTSGRPFYLGVTNDSSLTKGSGNSVVVLSRNQVGAVISRVDYDVMPRQGLSTGDGRSGVKNLWGMYFK